MPSLISKRLALQHLRDTLKTKHPIESLEPALIPPRAAFEAGLLAQGLHEVVSETAADYAAAFAFAFRAAALGDQACAKSVVVVSLASEAQERGALFGAGLAALGIDASRIVTVTAKREAELLWAAEEAATCTAVGAVVIVFPARERLYGFTASRRLKLRQEKSGVPLFVVRHTCGDATAATARWRISSAPSAGEITLSSSLPLLGRPRLHVRLERYRGLAPYSWEIDIDATHGFCLAAPLSNRPAGTPERKRRAA